MSSKNSINTIYSKWITYMEHIAQKLPNRQFVDLFWVTDKYVFDGYFAKTEYKFHFVGTPDEYKKVESRYMRDAWAYDRNATTNALLYPQDKEYIHHYVASSGDIYIFYLLEEIQEVTSNIARDDLSQEHSLICGLDAQSIPVLHDTLTIQSDQRHRYLGGHRLLFNTTVDTRILNRLQESIYRAGNTPLLIVCIMLVHAMLHLKCRLMYGIEPTGSTRHTKKRFVEEVIRHVPPALFGHSLLPIVTLREEDKK